MNEYTSMTLSRDEFLNGILGIVSTRSLRNPEKFQRILEIGRRYFNVDYAIISGFDERLYTVRQVSSSDAAARAGETLPFDETLCQFTVRNRGVTCFRNAREEEPGSHPKYGSFEFESYIGAPIEVEGRVVGTLCFESFEPRDDPHSLEEISSVATLAEWIASQIECDQIHFERDLLITSTPIHYLRVNASGIIERANQRTANLAGLDCLSIVDKPLAKALPAFDGLFDRAGQSETGSVSIFDEREQQYKNLKLCGIPFANIAGDEVDTIILGMDVTQIENQARQLKEINEELTRSNEDLRMVNQIAAHDLQEPLRKIRFFTEIFLEAADGNNREDMEKARETLVNAAERAQNLVTDLLSLRRISDCDVALGPIGLRELVNLAIERLSAQIAEAGVTLDFDFPDQIIHADRVLAPHLFQNLLSNAVFYRSKDVAARVNIAANVVGDSLVVTIEDNGIGFDPNFRDRIFKPFVRLDSVSRSSGSGIGLAVVARVADRHGWQVEADSDGSSGSTFTVRMPLDASVPNA